MGFGITIALISWAGSFEVSREAPPVMIWPTDARPRPNLEGELAAQGWTLVPFERAAQALARERRERQERADERLAEVDRALESARRAYLEQRWDEMREIVERAETRTLDVLALPEHCSTLWALEFTRGLAEHGADPGGEAWRAFALAGRLEPERRPSKAVYGPDVAAAFAEALERSRTRAVAVLDFDDAMTGGWIDCEPIPTSKVGLMSGLHVVWLGAPGYRTRAERIDVAAGTTEIELQAYRDDADPFEVLDAAPTPAHETEVGQQWILRAAQSLGASVVVVLDESPDAFAARVVTAEGAGRFHTGPTASASVAAALERVDEQGRLLPEAPPPRPAQTSPPDTDDAPLEGGSKPITKRWWFWTSIGAGVAVALALGLGLGLGLDREPTILEIEAR